MLRFLRWTNLEHRLFQKRLHNHLLLYVSPQEHIQRQLFWYGYYEKKYVLTWECFVSKDAIVLDVGANIGYYSFVAAHRASSGVVYAFEPHTANSTLLQQNTALNNLHNVIHVQAAVSDGPGEKTLFVSGSDNIGMTGLTKASNFSGRTEMVRTVLLDEWMEEAGVDHIDLVKMDIEGAEYQALIGMKAILKKWKPPLFMEVSNQLLQSYGYSSHEIYAFLALYGYQGYIIEAPCILAPVTEPAEDELVVFLPEGFSLPHGITLKS
jgi:FkbM family methyltransferase